MNVYENRFIRIRRFSEEQIGALHDCERAAGSDWPIKGVQKIVEIERGLPPFWDSGKEETEKAREIDQFLNCHAVKKAFAKMKASTEVSELVDVHSADWSVWKSAPMPYTAKGSGANRDKLSPLYKPAAKGGTPYADD